MRNARAFLAVAFGVRQRVGPDVAWRGPREVVVEEQGAVTGVASKVHLDVVAGPLTVGGLWRSGAEHAGRAFLELLAVPQGQLNAVTAAHERDGNLNPRPGARRCPIIRRSEPSEVTAGLIHGLSMSQVYTRRLKLLRDGHNELTSGSIVRVVEVRTFLDASRDTLHEGRHSGQDAVDVGDHDVLSIRRDQQVGLAVLRHVAVPNVGPVHLHELVVR